jgi:hypothetical protein
VSERQRLQDLLKPFQDKPFSWWSQPPKALHTQLNPMCGVRILFTLHPVLGGRRGVPARDARKRNMLPAPADKEIGTMNVLIFLFLSGLLQAAWAAQPGLVLPSGDGGWCDPLYSPDGRFIAFTNYSQDRIYVFEQGKDSPREVAQGEMIGRRFAFEPGAERIVFRMRSYALPGKPERIISTSIYLWDPVHHTSNNTGDLFGPYRIGGRIWYRYSLVGPFFDYDAHIRSAGPYWDTESGALSVINEALDTVFTTAPDQFVAGCEISPDGVWLAAVESRPERRTLLIRTSDGKTFGFPDAVAPSWAGNSQSLIAVTSRAERSTGLMIVRVPSGDARIILEDARFRPETPALNTDGSRALFVSHGAIYEMTVP